ncbi:hypothetical protein BD626DRAFT_503372 [Schizophyllum amplum]|uniref:Uncharacterized protein n=1 Tax=Schizophyllum amplum TaxID=97359 RepID=A0A550C868_9AGAR|nr:hypothetical protein BD626DRAFT_503372 [Auriculariopsis ampla]
MLSSRRTTSSLRRYPDERLFLLPYNDKMRIEYELRCFARPGGKLVAISQYRWHQACAFASGGEEQLYLIYKAVEDVLERLKATPMWEDLMEDGFIFDCLWDPNTRTCSLIELNPFGPMSSTGAALFNWIEDGQIIGGEHDKVVFRYCA